MERLERDLRGRARVASLGGRYYGMDRDQRWERTELFYDACVHGEGPQVSDAGGGDPRGVRARRDGRVHQADGRRRGRRGRWARCATATW